MEKTTANMTDKIWLDIKLWFVCSFSWDIHVFMGFFSFAVQSVDAFLWYNMLFLIFSVASWNRRKLCILVSDFLLKSCICILFWNYFSTDEAVSFQKFLWFQGNNTLCLPCICYLIYSVLEHELLISAVLVVFHCTWNHISRKTRVSIVYEFFYTT